MDGKRKAKTHLELNWVRDVKGNKKGFYKYTCSKRRAGKKVDPLLNGAGALVAKDMEKGKVFNSFFLSVFTGKSSLQESQAPESRGKVWSKEDLPSLEKVQVREHLNKLDINKSMGPDRIHP